MSQASRSPRTRTSTSSLSSLGCWLRLAKSPLHHYDVHMALGDAISTSDFLTQDQVGRRIAELRADRGVSQRRLAEAIGVDQSALSRIESGERGLAVEELVGIASFLAVDTSVVLRSEEDATPLFRNEGGPAEASEAVSALEAIIEDFFVFEAAART